MVIELGLGTLVVSESRLYVFSFTLIWAKKDLFLSIGARNNVNTENVLDLVLNLQIFGKMDSEKSSK
jgi:hypothetical protein